MTPRGGVTLIELIVVLAILGVMAGTSVAALAPLAAMSSGDRGALDRARETAIRTGMAVEAVLPRDSGYAPPVRFLPDGRGIGGGVSPLTGAPSEE